MSPPATSSECRDSFAEPSPKIPPLPTGKSTCISYSCAIFPLSEVSSDRWKKKVCFSIYEIHVKMPGQDLCPDPVTLPPVWRSASVTVLLPLLSIYQPCRLKNLVCALSASGLQVRAPKKTLSSFRQFCSGLKWCLFSFLFFFFSSCLLKFRCVPYVPAQILPFLLALHSFKLEL